jgi:tripartite-type tricarboxylate transporter receptor subunit TctC
MNRRLAIFLVAALSISGLASAADRDDRVTTVVVNMTAGGPLDVASRIVAEKLRALLGQPVVVINKVGVSGNVGANEVAKSAPDGLTVLFTTDAPVAINPLIFASVPFKTEDLKPVALIGSVQSAVSVNAGSGMQRLGDLVKQGKAGPMTFSSSGMGSPAHVGSAMLAQSTGIQVIHVPYKGGGPAALALEAGEVNAGVLATPGIRAFVKDGRIRPLAITSARRSSLFPDVATTAELGYPDIQADLLFLAMVPPKTPPATVAKLEAAITAALADASVKDRLSGLGIDASGPSNAAAAASALELLRARLAKIVKQADIKVE